ncbi:MAG: ABC transporter ATP-binding protein, partial [Desulfosalsimonas sp.]
MPPVVEARGIYKFFRNVRAVDGVDLEVSRGSFAAVLGPNGAGKTTLVEMIEGIQKPDRGLIRIMGMPWKKNHQAIRNIIGLSLQETRFMDRLNVWETLRLFASFFDLGKKRVKDILGLVGLEDKTRARVENLSGGQRQRLALGIALLNFPGILLLDEPTTGLDPNARREIWSILLDLKQTTDTSMILTTHYMEEAERLCDHIMIMDKGRVLREGRLEELLAGDRGGKIIDFVFDKVFRPQEDVFSSAPYPVKFSGQAGRASAVLDRLENQLPELMEFFRARGLR